MEVFVQAAIEQHAMDSICLLPFISPPEMALASSSLTTAFGSYLTQRRLFREVRVLSDQVNSDSDAIWRARREGCALVMRPCLVYMMDGTGALPTELVVRTRILDSRTGAVLWDVKQRGISEPGSDVDLTWNTLKGDPAQRCSVLANCLARRFAEYLAAPMEKETGFTGSKNIKPGHD
jgi:hypothetical protein